MGAACSRGKETSFEDLPLRLQVERVLEVGRSRGVVLPPLEGAPALVRLNVYGAGGAGLRGALVLFRPSSLEHLFHCGVEVHHCEWSYGGEERQWGFNWNIGATSHPTGVTCSVPRESPGHDFSESVPLGKTMLSEDEVLGIIQNLGRSWPAAEHDPMTKGCLHFSDAFCQMLGVSAVPERVRSLLAPDPATRSLAAVRQVLCNCEQKGGGTTDLREEDIALLQRQLEQAQLQLRQTQRDLATERAAHDEAIRQMIELKRTAESSQNGTSCAISPRSPRICIDYEASL